MLSTCLGDLGGQVVANILLVRLVVQVLQGIDIVGLEGEFRTTNRLEQQHFQVVVDVLS
jgi:hypothetical protein